MLNNDSERNLRVTLVDFGFAKKYKDQNRKPLPVDAETTCFEGNYLFASQNQMLFYVT